MHASARKQPPTHATTARTAPRVLVVDGDRDDREELLALLAEEGLTGAGVASGEEALRFVDHQRPGVAVVELTLSRGREGMHGVMIVSVLRQLSPPLPVVVVSAVGGGGSGLRVNWEPINVVPKVEPVRVLEAIRAALELEA